MFDEIRKDAQFMLNAHREHLANDMAKMRKAQDEFNDRVKRLVNTLFADSKGYVSARGGITSDEDLEKAVIELLQGIAVVEIRHINQPRWPQLSKATLWNSSQGTTYVLYHGVVLKGEEVKCLVQYWKYMGDL